MRRVVRRGARFAASGGLALLGATAGCATATATASMPRGDDGGAAAAIRAERARFNAAIVERDTATIARLLLPSYLIVTGRSAQGQGVAGEMVRWREAFADTSVRYVRRTREVRVNAAWGVAEELGDWTGGLTAPDGPVRASGSYAAKWQRDTGGRWRLQAEVFTTLACDGGPRGCRPPDPVAPLAPVAP